ncbi:MAG: crtB [Thermomicrobiales bacterium]|nr:crtB [Thermomicrobiales bacterium]
MRSMAGTADLPATTYGRADWSAAAYQGSARVESPASPAAVAGGAIEWRLCAAIARSHGRSFFLASHCLPPDRRRAIHAIYAYCRIADDIADHSADATSAALALDAWERQLAAPTHPVAVAFAAARAQHGVPVAPAQDLITGVRMDLGPCRFATWDDLRHYCYHVAGTVGLMVAPILGCEDEAALPYAVDLGIAMQLTNILRDVGEDARRGRLYLPLDELAAFSCDPEAILCGRPRGRFRELLAFQVARARNLYVQARRGIPALSPAGRLTTLAASEFYATILRAIEERDYDVFGARAYVPTGRKLAALPGLATDFVRLAWPPGATRGSG